jgi:hypothetical protein
MRAFHFMEAGYRHLSDTQVDDILQANLATAHWNADQVHAFEDFHCDSINRLDEIVTLLELAEDHWPDADYTDQVRADCDTAIDDLRADAADHFGTDDAWDTYVRFANASVEDLRAAGAEAMLTQRALPPATDEQMQRILTVLACAPAATRTAPAVTVRRHHHAAAKTRGHAL